MCLQPPVSAAAPSFSGHTGVPSLSPSPLPLTQFHCCGAEWSIPQKGQVLVRIPQMVRVVGIREGLKKELKASLDAPPGSPFHCAQGFLVFMTSYRKPSLLFKFLCRICDNISSIQCQETLGYIHKCFTESLKTQ